MKNHFPEQMFASFIFTTLNRGKKSPAENLSRLKNRFNRDGIFTHCVRGVRGVLYKVWMRWSSRNAKDVVILLMKNSNVGARLSVVNLDSKVNGVSAPARHAMLMPVNIDELKMVAIGRQDIQQNYETLSVLNVVQLKTYNSLILSHYGLAESTSGL